MITVEESIALKLVDDLRNVLHLRVVGRPPIKAADGTIFHKAPCGTLVPEQTWSPKRDNEATECPECLDREHWRIRT
jgi:hypothetical protein